MYIGNVNGRGQDREDLEEEGNCLSVKVKKKITGELKFPKKKYLKVKGINDDAYC